MKERDFKHLPDMSDDWKNTFGEIPNSFIMLAFGDSGNGKSSFIMQIIREIMHLGTILYVALEEGISATVQRNINRAFAEDEYYTNIRFTDHTSNYETLFDYLKGRNRERFIIIDSLQYWDIDYRKYKRLKEAFPRKSFIFISHAEGKRPSGKTGINIYYDATVKVFVSHYVAHIISRGGRISNYVIWEAGALQHFGKKELNKLIKAKN
ncbi:hypothetical protein D6B99_11820 [Arachidicoccus soli]|uniref:AAA+ ATPase domain-containing protein n=2 Tax=Arachidicoccus soli TaxID=2341117 RepID=A0A386HRN8_9BACT|nr:hypothetical protein D6B99_11820 [Arachidicoccus soli]